MCANFDIGVDEEMPHGPATMSSLSERIRNFLQTRLDQGEVSQAKLAQHLGVGRSAVSRMLSGERQISAVELMGIKDFFGLSFAEFGQQVELSDNDNLDMYLEARIESTAVIYQRTVVIIAYESGESKIAIPQAMFGSVKLADVKNLRWLRTYDDAMSPSIERGDTLIIDESVKGATGLYVLEIAPGQRSVRRLDGGRREGEDLLVHVGADNTKFRSYDSPLSALRVIGLVLLRITDRI